MDTKNVTIPAFNFEEGYYELKKILKQEREDNQKLSTSLKQVVEDRDQLKQSLSASAKDVHILQLKCQELEQKIGVLTEAEKCREQTPKKNSKTSDSLKKIGLTEDILLALPFGYSTKVRSAFEKLSYENEKLKMKLEEVELVETKKIVEEKERLLKMFEVVSMEKAAVEENEKDVRRQMQMLLEKNQWLLSVVAALGKEVVEVPKSDKKQESLSELKLRCNLLSKINTNDFHKRKIG